MKTYIIKNCPCYDKEYEECLNTPRDTYKNCVDISDCLLKRIAERCKDNACIIGTCDTANEILEMLDIEEEQCQ